MVNDRFHRLPPPSLPSRGAWIEITWLNGRRWEDEVAPLAGSVDRNLHFSRPDKGPLRSLPSRGAWIEIHYGFAILYDFIVAPLAGSVDRNVYSVRDQSVGIKSLPSRGAWIEISSYSPFKTPVTVAPLAGSVDRNGQAFNDLTEIQVAPLAGSVDRNIYGEDGRDVNQMSLPSRGAWIEMPTIPWPRPRAAVAPLAGSVDRNLGRGIPLPKENWVAPLAGSVDRNLPKKARGGDAKPSLPSRGAWIEIIPPRALSSSLPGRSPRGERG